MEITLSLSSDELENDELQELTRKLCGDLRDEVGVDASLVVEDSAPGTRGDMAILGQIAMTLIGSGGVVVTAIKVLEAYAKKNRKVEIKVKTAKAEIVVKFENSNSSNSTEVISQLKALLADEAK